MFFGNLRRSDEQRHGAIQAGGSVTGGCAPKPVRFFRTKGGAAGAGPGQRRFESSGLAALCRSAGCPKGTQRLRPFGRSHSVGPRAGHLFRICDFGVLSRLNLRSSRSIAAESAILASISRESAILGLQRARICGHRRFRRVGHGGSQIRGGSDPKNRRFMEDGRLGAWIRPGDAYLRAAWERAQAMF